MSHYPTVTLRPGRDKLPRNHHPWIFSGAIQSVSAATEPGDTVNVNAANGTFVACGQISEPGAALAVRLLDWRPETVINREWFQTRIQDAVDTRRTLISAETNACRLIFSESDLLPGLIVDQFADTLILQAGSPGMDRYKSLIAECLLEIVPDAKRVIEKSDSDGRNMSGLADAFGLLAGSGEPDTIPIIENGLRFSVSLKGQKTGFYTDQRSNRRAIERWVIKDADVLDVCCYTGAFSAAALKSGARHVTLTDISAPALAAAAENLQLNGFEQTHFTTRRGSAFDTLRTLRAENKMYDMIILDPPKLIRSAKQSPSGYKDLNFQAMQLLNPGGILVTFSCSGNLSAEDFRKVIAYAAKDAGKTVRILEQLHQAADHPILTAVPETEYLKGLICRVTRGI